MLDSGAPNSQLLCDSLSCNITWKFRIPKKPYLWGCCSWRHPSKACGCTPVLHSGVIIRENLVGGFRFKGYALEENCATLELPCLLHLPRGNSPPQCTVLTTGTMAIEPTGHRLNARNHQPKYFSHVSRLAIPLCCSIEKLARFMWVCVLLTNLDSWDSKTLYNNKVTVLGN